MSDIEYLNRALELARESPEPVGCGTVIVDNGEIIAETYNSQKADTVAVNHAEIKAVIAANKARGTRKLEGATAYCSCEPCAMCLTALSYAHIGRIVYARSMKDLFPDDPQSDFDAQTFVMTLNFVPKLEQIAVELPPKKRK